jgi:hypothetical protein
MKAAKSKMNKKEKEEKITLIVIKLPFYIAGRIMVLLMEMVSLDRICHWPM